jgi:hypothetical protein
MILQQQGVQIRPLFVLRLLLMSVEMEIKNELSNVTTEIQKMEMDAALFVRQKLYVEIC